MARTKAAAAPAKRGRGRPRKDNGSGFGAMAGGMSEAWKKKTAALGRKKRAKKTEEVAGPKKRGRKPGNKAKKTRDKEWAAFTSSQLAPKRGRGRPKGSTNKAKVATETAAPKKRGRPRKVAEAAPVAKRPRGRPRKNPVATVAAAPKKRGRKPGSTKKVLRSKRISKKVARHTKLFGIAGRVMRTKEGVVPVFKKGEITSSGKKRGRPKGSKDKVKRKARGSVNGGMGMVGNMAVKNGMPTKAKLSSKGGVSIAKPSRTNVKMTVHRPVNTKIGTVKSKRGKLKVG